VARGDSGAKAPPLAARPGGTSGASAAAGGICARNRPKHMKASCGYFG